MFSCCPQIFTTFNWGANYEKFREATALWRLTLSNLVNFSDTRFANSKRRVFKNILNQFAPFEAAFSKLRDNAAKAKEFLGRIFNEEFLLILSDLTDINI